MKRELYDIKLADLLKIQAEVDAVVGQKAPDVRMEEMILAFNVEFFEFINEVGIWKWWKHSHVPNRARILDELADCFAFFLKMANAYFALSDPKISIEEMEQQISQTIAHYHNFLEEKGSGTLDRVKTLSILFGAENELEDAVSTTTLDRISIAIYIAWLLFEDATWDDITDAYKLKSQENIDRQKRNY